MGYTYRPTSISIDPNSGHESYEMDDRVRFSYTRMIPSMKTRARAKMRWHVNESEYECIRDQLYNIGMILVWFWCHNWYHIGFILVSIWYCIIPFMRDICVHINTFWRPYIIWSKQLRWICIWKIVHMNKWWIWNESKRTNSWIYAYIDACVQLWRNVLVWYDIWEMNVYCI